ncbi:terminase small subunit protein [Ochrobactrum sp. AP1BH01-1]|uniref:terminase small subunit-like protein n=1 Tax=Ochrobactrum sp. AP1BH01-1 TaxID=2823874 RepID=UPI001B3976AE|nr:terminase small subunit protein [Ochrobactrum sp. AP1BH01-1]MBQ0707851.1 terminase small subunit protein [Ochrobactrum sp. AP1BH01-1]
MTEEAPKPGRPSDYTQEVADLICERIADGESLRTICDDQGMPSRTTVFKWLSRFNEFADQYARAREAQADTLFDEILSIADDGRNDWMEKTNKDGEVIGEVFNKEAVQRSSLRVEARKWMAGKLRPKKYSEKLDLNVSGSLQTTPEEQLNARIAELLGKAGVAIAAGGTGAPEEDK